MPAPMAAPRLLLALFAFDMAVARADGGRRGVLADGGATVGGSGDVEDEKEVVVCALGVAPLPPPPKGLAAVVLAGVGVAVGVGTLALKAAAVVAVLDCGAPVCKVVEVVGREFPPPPLPVAAVGTLEVLLLLVVKVEEGLVVLLVLL